MNNRRKRSWLFLIKTIILSWLYIPHILFWIGSGSKLLINSDLEKLEYQIGLKLPRWLQLLYQLHNNRYYRNLFYHRIGPVKALFMEWYRPGDRYFLIGNRTKIGKGMWFAHPYATVLAAESIGDNFRCINNITIGHSTGGKPTIGDNVSVMANAVIVGAIHIGNNVTIAAGAVVIRDVPDNCVVAGVPAKVVKYIEM